MTINYMLILRKYSYRTFKWRWSDYISISLLELAALRMIETTGFDPWYPGQLGLQGGPLCTWRPARITGWPVMHLEASSDYRVARYAPGGQVQSQKHLAFMVQAPCVCRGPSIKSAVTRYIISSSTLDPVCSANYQLTSYKYVTTNNGPTKLEPCDFWRQSARPPTMSWESNHKPPVDYGWSLIVCLLTLRM
jgi:hypothetical protein